MESVLSGVEIPALGRKLRLFIEKGSFADWNDLAKEFGVEAKTVQWWGHGDMARASNTLPGKHLKTLLRVLATQFEEELSNHQAKELLFAPLDYYESAFSSISQISLNALIARDAIKANARLFKQAAGNNPLVQIDKPQPQPDFTLKIGELFRLEIDQIIDRGFAFVLQNVSKSWGFVSSEIRKGKKSVIAPPFDDAGLPQFMSETSEMGLHRFILIETSKPFPPSLHRYEQDSVPLDGLVLSRIAEHYQGQPNFKRSISIVAILIGEM